LIHRSGARALRLNGHWLFLAGNRWLSIRRSRRDEQAQRRREERHTLLHGLESVCRAIQYNQYRENGGGHIGAKSRDYSLCPNLGNVSEDLIRISTGLGGGAK